MRRMHFRWQRTSLHHNGELLPYVPFPAAPAKNERESTHKSTLPLYQIADFERFWNRRSLLPLTEPQKRLIAALESARKQLPPGSRVGCQISRKPRASKVRVFVHNPYGVFSNLLLKYLEYHQLCVQKLGDALICNRTALASKCMRFQFRDNANPLRARFATGRAWHSTRGHSQSFTRVLFLDAETYAPSSTKRNYLLDLMRGALPYLPECVDSLVIISGDANNTRRVTPFMRECVIRGRAQVAALTRNPRQLPSKKTSSPWLVLDPSGELDPEFDADPCLPRLLEFQPAADSQPASPPEPAEGAAEVVAETSPPPDPPTKIPA